MSPSPDRSPSADPGERAIRVILLGTPGLSRYLARLDFETQTIKTIPRLLAPNEGHDARAIVIGRDALIGYDIAETIGRIRDTWPLVDIIVWAPGAESPFVRAALKAGVKDVLLTDSPEICSRAVANTVSAQQLMPKAARLGFDDERRAVFQGMLARSRSMWDLFDTTTRIAPTDAAVLLLGETGTGKELLARALHRCSEREGRFVAVNCAAIAEHLIDSELFGHVEGAFTGASKDKAGLFRHADRGTLMLDEIGCMPQTAQHHLLRALQEGTVRPVGSHQEIPVDVRIIAATSTALEADVESGRFREDLYYRLDVIRLEIPPLRQRTEDILFLFGHFMSDFAKQYDVPRPEMTDAFLEALIRYEWPGNVRQLENFTERLVLTHGARRATAGDLNSLLPFIREAPPASAPGPSPTHVAPDPGPALTIDITRPLDEHLRPIVARHEAAYLRACLRHTGGRVGDSAAMAGISRRTLLRKLRLYDIDKAEFRRAVASSAAEGGA